MSWKKFKNKKPNDGDRINVVNLTPPISAFVGRYSNDRLYLVEYNYINIPCSSDEWWWSYLPVDSRQEECKDTLRSIIDDCFRVSVSFDEDDSYTCNISFIDETKLNQAIGANHVIDVTTSYNKFAMNIDEKIGLNNIVNEYNGYNSADPITAHIIQDRIKNEMYKYECENNISFKDILLQYLGLLI